MMRLEGKIGAMLALRLRNLLLAAFVCLGALLVAPAPARAEGEAAAAPAAPASGGSLDFDLLDTPKPDAAAEAANIERAQRVERQIAVRRKMLIAHQAIGFTTLAVMAAAVVIGQLNYVARYGGLNNGMDYDRYQNAHLGLTITSTALFTTLGILGVAAPNPYPKPIKADAALVHKVAMILATAGMVTQLILGPVTASYEGKLNQRDLALGHVITGYATWGFMAAGVLAYVF
jgi:hypothetical protein